MLDFSPIRERKMTVNELVAGLARADLARLTNEMVDKELGLIAGCGDADVVFEPSDPGANDVHAVNPDEVTMPWTLGHVIVHATASSEEAAALAVELARGVPLHGRSRYETPWREVTTIALCRARLEESRRMRLASLEMWPDTPHLDVMADLWAGMAPVHAVGRFMLGLMHDDSHLGQIAEIVRKAHASMPAMPQWSEGDLDVNGACMHYHRTGQPGSNKPALVLAHGFSDAGMCWLPLALELSSEYDVVLPDARGHGGSARVKADEALDMAADLAGLIQGLKLELPVIGGHSMGASVSAQTAARYPDLMRGLILEDPAWFLPKNEPKMAERPANDPNRDWLKMLKGKSVEEVMVYCRKNSPTWGEIELRPWAESKLVFDPGFLDRRQMPEMGGWAEAAKAIRCPTLLITADVTKGAIVSAEAAALAVSLNPLIQVVCIEGAGHSIRREAFPAYLAAVKNFLHGL